ncbi:MAG: choice-of-anchor D domain-containing protein [Myxococcales bacterium]|nr:choice-of-anchor D domain-containing protein [Myxococcales bacterium]MCB9524892.1 choice-of-anchor D domain-containing protein [Myxococcales bacterium]
MAATGCDDSINSTAAARLDLAPDRFLFPRAQAGDVLVREVELSNGGQGTLKLIEFGRSSYDLDQFSLEWYAGDDETAKSSVFPATIDVAPGDRITLRLTYTPTDSSGARGSVGFRCNDPNKGVVTIPISSPRGGAEIFVQPDSISFGRVPAGATAEETLTISNIGSEALLFDSIVVGGSADFSLRIGDVNVAEDPSVLVDPDGDGQDGLAPEGTITATVVYAPPTEGPDSGELIIRTNDGNRGELVVPITANGAAPCIQVSPPTLEFSAALVGRTTPKPVTITSCGQEGLSVSNIRLSEDTAPAYRIREDFELPLNLPGATPENQPSELIAVEFTPEDEAAYGGKLIIESNDAATPSVEVPIVGRGTINECPVPGVAQASYTVLPLDIIRLDASSSMDPDGSIARYEWVVVERPNGSTAVPHETFFNRNSPADGGRDDDTSTPEALFFVDLAGHYVFELRVTDNLDLVAPSESCPEPVARVEVTAEPNEDIHVQLVWDTARDGDQTDDDGTDVDLHLLHPLGQRWSQAPLDCYFANKNPDWGPPGAVANPSLDIDDVNGAGPENINLDEPENTASLGAPYRVGVHYYRSESFLVGDYGTSAVTLRIYLGGQLIDEFERDLVVTDNFWTVAGIEWTPQERRVVEINRFWDDINQIP